MREMGQRGNFFFLHFYSFQSILSRLRHFFFSKNFREREAQNAREQSARDASVKPEGGKLAGLAGRPAKQACRLVFYIFA